jgi:hypothetical protein
LVRSYEERLNRKVVQPFSRSPIGFRGPRGCRELLSEIRERGEAQSRSGLGLLLETDEVRGGAFRACRSSLSPAADRSQLGNYSLRFSMYLPAATAAVVPSPTALVT